MGRSVNEIREEVSGVFSAGRPFERERVIGSSDQNIIYATIQNVCGRFDVSDKGERLIKSRKEHSGRCISGAGRQGKSIEQIVFRGD